MRLPRAVVPLEAAVLFVQLESLSAFVSVFCAPPFQLRVLCCSHEGFARPHSPVKLTKLQNKINKYLSAILSVINLPEL